MDSLVKLHDVNSTKEFLKNENSTQQLDDVYNSDAEEYEMGGQEIFESSTQIVTVDSVRRRFGGV